MNAARPLRTHLIVGGYPPGATAGHDMDYARLRLLQFLSEQRTTVANDFADVDKWLADCDFLVTYVAGPYPDAEQNQFISDWLHAGGRWLALHGTSGGKAARIPDSRQRKMVKLAHHETLGSFFLNHPPVRKFRVDVTDTGHPLMSNVPDNFEVMDELYFIEMQDPDAKILLTTELDRDPAPGFGFVYDEDTSLQSDGKTRVLGYLKETGEGAVVYYALGHCHSPVSNSQPFVDESVDADGKTPLTFRGSWESPAFEQLLGNAISWASS